MIIRELLRRRMLAELYGKMSDSDKLSLLQSFTDDGAQQQALSRIESKIDRMGFSRDLLANLSGNAISYALFWIGKTLFGKL